LIDSLLHHIINAKTNEEAIYATRTIINLSYNSDIKARNYDKACIPIS